MKIRSSVSVYFIVLLSFISLFGGCQKVEDGLSSIVWRINFDLVTTTWDVQFLDAATGLPIGANGSERVAVTITGDDQANILDLAGIRQSVFYSAQGELSLALHPDRQVPTAQAPVKFFIHAQHSAYLPVTVPVLTYSGGISPIRIYLVNRSNAPDQIDMITQVVTGALASGTLTDSLFVQTPAGQASVQFRTGTALTDARGNTLSGDIHLCVSHWQGGTTNGSLMLPGGQIAINSQHQPGLIYPAGAVYADIKDQNGLVAAAYSQPATAIVAVSDWNYDPLTRQSLSEESPLPLWWLNTETGLWESQGTVIPEGPAGHRIVNLSMPLPGLYLVGWIHVDLNAAALLLHPVPVSNQEQVPYAFTLNVFEVNGDHLTYLQSMEIHGPVDQDYPLYFLPNQSELMLRFDAIEDQHTFYATPGPVLLPSSHDQSLPVDLSLAPETGKTFKKIRIVLVDPSRNDIRYTPKMFPGYYRKMGTSIWQSAYVYDYQAYIIDSQVGDRYELGINYKGGFHRAEVVIGTEDVVTVEITID